MAADLIFQSLDSILAKLTIAQRALEIYADRDNWLDDSDGRLPIVDIGRYPAVQALESLQNPELRKLVKE